MIDIQAAIDFFEEHNFTVQIFYRLLHRNEWSVIVEKKDDGISVKANTEHSDMAIAINDAYEKVHRLITRGAPAMLYPTIEHSNKPTEIAHQSNAGVLDTLDDIPY